MLFGLAGDESLAVFFLNRVPLKKIKKIKISLGPWAWA
jgi:hypothetical protein